MALGVGIGISAVLQQLIAGGPSYSASFMQPPLASGIQFQRASARTVTNSTGQSQTIAADQPGFDYDPSTAVTNYVPYSEDFSQWTNDQSAPAAILAGTAPDGSGDRMWTLADNDTTAFARYGRSYTGLTVGTVYVAQVNVLKGLSNQAFQFQCDGNKYTRWNLANNVQGQFNGAGSLFRIDKGTYWQVGFSFTAANANASITINPAISQGGVTFSDGNVIATGSITCWGVQISEGTAPARTVRSGATAVTACVANGLLIEEQRTNLGQYSESDGTNGLWTSAQRLTPNYNATETLSPSGSANVIKYVETTDAGSHTSNSPSGVTGATGTTYSLSYHLKAGTATIVQLTANNDTIFTNGEFANFDLVNGVVTNSGGSTVPTMRKLKDGWWRCTITAVATNPATRAPLVVSGVNNVGSAGRGPSYTGTGLTFYGWGYQVEVGGFPTSHISTTNAAATRAADLCSAATSSWFNPDAGTFVVETLKVSNATGTYFTVQKPGTAEYMQVYTGGTVNLWKTRVAGSNIFDHQFGPSLIGTPNRVATAYQANNYADAANGNSALKPPNDISVPSEISILYLGCFNSSSIYLNGWLRNFAYYSSRLPDAQIQSLTL